MWESQCCPEKGSTDAFLNTIQERNPGLEGVYIDGVYIDGTVSPSLMELQVHDSISGHLLQLYMKPTQPRVCPCTNTNFTWPFQIPSIISSNYFCDTGNFGPGLSFAAVCTKTIHCGMVRGVVLLAPAANSTTLLGSAQHCHNPLLMTSN